MTAVDSRYCIKGKASRQSYTQLYDSGKHLLKIRLHCLDSQFILVRVRRIGNIVFGQGRPVRVDHGA